MFEYQKIVLQLLQFFLFINIMNKKKLQKTVICVGEIDQVEDG